MINRSDFIIPISHPHTLYLFPNKYLFRTF